MKALCVSMFFVFWTGYSCAAPSSQLIKSCLKTEPTEGIRYVDIAPDSFHEEEDDVRKTTTTTISFRKREVGIWKKTESTSFGVIYGNRRIPANHIIQLGSHTPSTFNPYTAQWGEASEGKNAYVCITFNFEGLGESGSFQNIRGLYLIDTNSSRPNVYYTAGDIRLM